MPIATVPTEVLATVKVMLEMAPKNTAPPVPVGQKKPAGQVVPAGEVAPAAQNVPAAHGFAVADVLPAAVQ